MEHRVIGVLEYSNTATGIQVLDAMAKAASVEIVDAKTICPGKFYVIIAGLVADVEASLEAVAPLTDAGVAHLHGLRALRSLEKHRSTFVDPTVEQRPGVGDELAQALPAWRRGQ